MPRTTAQKIWEAHLADRREDAPDLLYIDLHLLNEVMSAQAFEGLRDAGRTVRRPDLTLAVEDHNVPTQDVFRRIADATSREQVETLRRNCRENDIELYSMGTSEQGIVHIIGPQLGLTQPGMTIVCGDSHTSTHGAFGALAFGIGTSEVEHVLATQTLPMAPFRTMAVTVEGILRPGVTAKDLILYIVSRLGTGGGAGYVLEYRGSAIRALSMEERMTVCNMSIEAGARAGLIAPDETTIEYLRGRRHVPAGDDFERVAAQWLDLVSDEDAEFDADLVIQAADIAPFITWGTTPAQGVPLDGVVPDPCEQADDMLRERAHQALSYMGLEPGTPMREISIDTVFIGSCTNGRIEDLRAAASVLAGQRIRQGVSMLVVPGSERIREQAEFEGLDRVFLEAGAEWRHAGCSACLGMNPDKVLPQQRCVSTSNRNFEGRQGPGARTHLASPAVAAASAVMGRIAAPTDLKEM